jgi:adenosylcobinamide-phosphate synthase
MHDLIVLLTALLLDALLGDPPNWPHMVRLMGMAISKLEYLLRKKATNPKALRLAGAVLTLSLVFGSAAFAWGIIFLAGAITPGLGLLAALGFTFQSLAPGQLWREAKKVAFPLDQGDLAEARQRLGMIVGRETSELTESQIR